MHCETLGDATVVNMCISARKSKTPHKSTFESRTALEGLGTLNANPGLLLFTCNAGMLEQYCTTGSHCSPKLTVVRPAVMTVTRGCTANIGWWVLDSAISRMVVTESLLAAKAQGSRPVETYQVLWLTTGRHIFAPDRYG